MLGIRPPLRVRALRDVITDDNANLPRHITRAKQFDCVVRLFIIPQSTTTRVFKQLDLRALHRSRIEMKSNDAKQVSQQCYNKNLLIGNTLKKNQG